MSFWDYLSAKALPLCMAGMAGLYLVLVWTLCALPFSLLLMLLCSGLFVLLLCLLLGWRRADRRLRTLQSRLEALPEKYLIGETLPRPRDAVEREYFLLMKEISRSAIGAVEQAQAEKQDYCDDVERWVHEIKTPLTACNLILANGADPVKLRRELRRADNLTETIVLPLNLQKRPLQETRDRLQSVADSLEIRSQLDKFPRQLSGGQRQRAACARALITNPALILADEPTGALDSANAKSLMQTFTMMNQRLGSTILMVTHDAVVGSYASRVLFLKDGQIWNELYRGDRTRQAMFHEILNTMAVLGGEADVR